jgi:anti-anti-sigma regulatory factor
MSFVFLAHPWEVKNVDDGLMVTVSQNELDASTIAVLVDELVELARESGQGKLYVDFSQVRQLANIVFGKLITLDAKLRNMDCRLTLCNVQSYLYQSFQAARLTDNLDIRLSPASEALTDG